MKKNIPIMFQKLKQYNIETNDTRFMKVKIWIMHLENNYNGSYFSKEVVEEAIESLDNTPILAFIKEDSNGNKDFSDHEFDEDGKYIGQAIGVIPGRNNAKFEFRLCDDGIEREFLTVEGLIWTKFEDPVNIFENCNVKFQSMELHDDFEGYIDKKDKLFHFTKFNFYGACILGEDIEPAMENSTIELQFSKSKYDKIIEEKFKQFSRINEGGKVLKRTEILKRFSYLKGEKFNSIVNDKDLNDEELEKKLFSLSNNDLESKIREKLKEFIYEYENCWGEKYMTAKYWLTDTIPDDKIIIVEDNEDYYKHYGIPYEIQGDEVILKMEESTRYIRGDWRKFKGKDVEINPIFSILKEKDKELFGNKIKDLKSSFNVKETEEFKSLETKFIEIQKNFSILEKERDELKIFKTNLLTEQLDKDKSKLFTRFSDLEGFEGFEELKVNQELSLEELEKECFTLAGKKAFSLKSTSKKVKNNFSIPIEHIDEDLTEAQKRYGKDL